MLWVHAWLFVCERDVEGESEDIMLYEGKNIHSFQSQDLKGKIPKSQIFRRKTNKLQFLGTCNADTAHVLVF